MEHSDTENVEEWSSRICPVLIASFIFFCGLEACLWVRNQTLKKKLPGPFAWPLVGNAMQLGKMPHLTFSELAKKYGNVYQIRLGSVDVVVLNGEAVIREALLQHAVEFAGRPDFASYRYISGGKSLTFNGYSRRWKMHRKIAHSSIRAFSSGNVGTRRAFEGNVSSEAVELVRSFLRLGADSRSFDPSHELKMAAANVVCALCFGKRYGRDDPEFSALLSRANKFGEVVGAGSLIDVMPWLRAFPNPVRNVFRIFRDLSRDFFSFVKGKVAEHRKTYDPEVTRDMSDAIIGAMERAGADADAGADASADADVGLTQAHTEATIADLIGAGLDTVSTALHWMLLLLVKYPRIQREIQDEIDKSVGRDRLPSVEDKSALVLLDAFIYEVMRYTSFVPVTIPHSTTSDVTIEGLHIPKNTVVFINQWSVNHDPQKWRDPHVFNPSRFLDENGDLDKDLTNGVMIFSTGKRRCIGDQIAKVEMFLMVATLLHQLRFERDPEQDLGLNCSYGLTLKPNYYNITAKPRGTLLSAV